MCIFREEGILVLSGGLTVHNLRDPITMAPRFAKPVQKDFNSAILASVAVADVGVAPTSWVPINPVVFQ